MFVNIIEDKFFEDFSKILSLSNAQGVDLAYLQTGISGAFFWILNFESLYFLILVTGTVFSWAVKQMLYFEVFYIYNRIFSVQFYSSDTSVSTVFH